MKKKRLIDHIKNIYKNWRKIIKNILKENKNNFYKTKKNCWTN